eukprot:1835045-Prymnesium_polylepis.1
MQQLCSGNTTMYERLINLVLEFDQQEKKKTTVTAPKQVVQEIRQQTDQGRQILDAVINRRSPRIAQQNDSTTEGTAEVQRRRSARIAARN